MSSVFLGKIIQNVITYNQTYPTQKVGDGLFFLGFGIVSEPTLQIILPHLVSEFVPRCATHSPGPSQFPFTLAIAIDNSLCEFIQLALQPYAMILARIFFCYAAVELPEQFF